MCSPFRLRVLIPQQKKKEKRKAVAPLHFTHVYSVSDIRKIRSHPRQIGDLLDAVSRQLVGPVGDRKSSAQVLSAERKGSNPRDFARQVAVEAEDIVTVKHRKLAIALHSTEGENVGVGNKENKNKKPTKQLAH
ncbi:predicted protein [Histoplasma capsulatum H143]|uniref:Uncharacterized protein n=1 Tax=Ajellomyces capsulatus (strain H143) TaxID=544712 RepID=C6HRI7_AJECH|nr:predicted protein [Histoplasma capsulatum H143]